MRHWAKHILLGPLLASGACTGPARDSAATAAPATHAVDTGRANGAALAETIATGSNLALASVVRVCTGISQPGDVFTASVTGSVIGSHGAVIPVGSIVVGRVVDSRDSLHLAFDSLAIGTASYPIAARLVGSPQTVGERASVPGSALGAFRSKGVCIPEHGRITIQLTADLPLASPAARQ